MVYIFKFLSINVPCPIGHIMLFLLFISAAIIYAVFVAFYSSGCSNPDQKPNIRISTQSKNV
jgi:hypothetical protein